MGNWPFPGSDKVCQTSSRIWELCIDDHCTNEHQYWGNHSGWDGWTDDYHG